MLGGHLFSNSFRPCRQHLGARISRCSAVLCFPMLSCHAALCAYILGSVQQVRYGIPMRNCVHCFVCVSCSVALRNPTVATPLLREYTLFINGVAFSWTALTRCPRILQLHLFCGVFFFWQCMLRTSWCTYLAGSVKHIRNGFPSKT